MLAPVRRRLTAEDAAERAAAGRPADDAEDRAALMVRGFWFERVFRYGDTDGEPLPEVAEVRYVTGDTPEGPGTPSPRWLTRRTCSPWRRPGSGSSSARRSAKRPTTWPITSASTATPSTTGQSIETTRTMGTGRDARDRRLVYQWRFARYRHDIQAINAAIERAEAVPPAHAR